MTDAGSQQTLNRAIIHSVTKRIEKEKLGNGKRNATSYSARISKEGHQEAELLEKALERLKFFLGKLADPGKMGSRQGLDQAWGAGKGSLGNVEGGQIKEILKKIGVEPRV